MTPERRAVHALAAVLGTSTASIERGMSAREFSQWCQWMQEEQVGPVWNRLQLAQLLAAIYNGPSQRVGGGVFTPSDFLPAAPAAAPSEQTADEVAANLAEGFGALDWAGVKGVRVG